jgi:hypothetical protein
MKSILIKLFHKQLSLKEMLKWQNLKSLKSESLNVKILSIKNLKILEMISIKFKSYQMRIKLSQLQAKKDLMIKSALLCQLLKKPFIKMSLKKRKKMNKLRFLKSLFSPQETAKFLQTQKD